MRHIEHVMGDIIRLASINGVDGVRFKPARFDKVTESLTKSPDAGIASQWMPLQAKSHHAGPSYLGGHCNFLWGHATVHSDGAIASCCEAHLKKHDAGHIENGTFFEQWNGPAFRRMRRVALGHSLEPGDEATPCLACKVFNKPFTKEARQRADRNAVGA
jgi:hypothetical protein